MALIKRRSVWLKLLFFIPFIILAIVGYNLISANLIPKDGPYEKLSMLPAEFVFNCQRAAASFHVPWELLAASAQIRLEHRLISEYPGPNELIITAGRLARAMDHSDLDQMLAQLGYAKPMVKEIKMRTRLFKSKSAIFSEEYGFPYQQKVYYVDTWGAEREGGKRTHEGTDLFAPEGTPIYSVSEGIVERLGWNRLGGERVGVRGKDKIYYYYAHLSRINPNLQIGMPVSKGALLGYTGHTGDAMTTPDHLHFGMELPEGKWINPYNFLSYWQKYNQ